MTDQPPAPPAARPPPAVEPTNGLAVAALALGIIAIVICWIPLVGFFGFICGLVGLFVGIIAAQNPIGRGMAVGGIICSGIAILVWIVGLIIIGALLSAYATSVAAHQ